MILTIDAGSRGAQGSIIMEAWKVGVEVEKLTGNHLELISADEDRLGRLIKKFPNVTILHRELVKEVSIYDNSL
jgi:hypothetical protein